MSVIISSDGSTAIVYRFGPGVVAKVPRDVPQSGGEIRLAIENAFAVEEGIFQVLGSHPRIPKFYGRGLYEARECLLFSEANRGPLQAYIDEHGSSIDAQLRRKWCLQAAEATAHVHAKGVIHQDMNTRNFLVHSDGASTDILLSDFGGSFHQTLQLDGGNLPDDPFDDPTLSATDETPQRDVFGLGIVMYVIITGHLPFHNSPAPEGEARFSYSDNVRQQFLDGHFPDLTSVYFGDVIEGCCCTRIYHTAGEVLAAVQLAQRNFADSTWQSAVEVP